VTAAAFDRGDLLDPDDVADGPEPAEILVVVVVMRVDVDLDVADEARVAEGGGQRGGDASGGRGCARRVREVGDQNAPTAARRA
jgi:hypothetical protein